MTATINRRITRQTPAVMHSRGRRRNVLVTLSPGGDGSPGPSFVGFRLHGMRSTYWLPVGWCFTEALKADRARVKRERKEARKR